MRLYHCTTEKRMEKIICDKKLKTECLRFFTKELNGPGATTQGYVYLSNEPTCAVYFGNCHSLVDKSTKLYLLRFDLSDGLLEADWDEIQYQKVPEWKLKSYVNELQCSLLELKTCRVSFDIDFSKILTEYCLIDKNVVEIADIVKTAGRDYKYVVEHYTDAQKNFLSSLIWKRIE